MSLLEIGATYAETTDGETHKVDSTKRVVMECPQGNSPTCPSCGNWNSMLDKPKWEGEERTNYFECRDCGFLIKADNVMVRVMKLDKPGMGRYSTYTEVAMVKGESY